MIQIVTYAFTTIENPLSNGGNFSQTSMVPSSIALKVASAGICESTLTGSAAGAYWSGAVPPGDTGGLWPADEYCEVTLQAYNSSDNLIIGARQQSGANSRYQVQFNSTTATVQAVAAGVNTTLSSGAVVAAANDVWRISVTGNVVTVTQNGTNRGGTPITDSGNVGPAGAGVGPVFFIVSNVAVGQSAYSVFSGGANQATAPTFSPPAGAYPGAQPVTLTGPVGSTIFYTLDGSTPTRSSSSVASGGTVIVTPPKTLNATSSASNFVDSVVASGTYTVGGAVGDLAPGYDFKFRL